MKSACILLKNSKSNFSDLDYLSVLESFCACGYAASETRILCDADENKIIAAVLECKKEYNTLFLLAESKQLLGVKSLVLPLFKNETQSLLNGMGIFSDQEKTLCLLSAKLTAECEEFIKAACIPYFLKTHGRLDKFVVRAIGANALRVEQLLGKVEALAQGKILLRHARSHDEDVITAFYGETTPKMLIDDALRIFAEGLQDCVYALEDCNLETQLVHLLKLRARKISVAESFTGGGIAKRITSVSGVSEVYFEGLNTYNELSKIKRLGVREYTLKTVGAVSDQTAYEMAAGLIATGDCDLAIATTGLAGPNSDKSGLPVGLCYIAIGQKESVTVYRYKFDGTREEITKKAINYALFLAYKQIKNE
jgi:nicotinamide-nucleotide amidase